MVATADKVASSLRSGRLNPAVPHFKRYAKEMKRPLIIAAAIVSLVIFTYLVVRAVEIRNADRTADTFFAQFRSADGGSANSSLVDVHQENEEIQAILRRHGQAIRNYTYEEHAPLMDLTLRTAIVEVSWHLNIVLSKGQSGWYISKLDEYIPDEARA